MAINPAFAATPKVGIGTVSVTNTNRDGTGTIVDCLTAGSSGTRVNSIVVKATSDPADCTVVIYIYDGATYQVFDELDLGNPSAGDATTASYRGTLSYTDLIIPATYKIAASITAAPTAGTVKVFVMAGDL